MNDRTEHDSHGCPDDGVAQQAEQAGQQQGEPTPDEPLDTGESARACVCPFAAGQPDAEQEPEAPRDARPRPRRADGLPAAVGVSFRRGGKIYHFEPNGVAASPGEHVLVRTEKGVDIGEVVSLVFDPARIDTDEPLKPVVRKATAEDLEFEDNLRVRERKALRVCERKIAEHELPMKLIDADYTFDCRCLIFFFSAEGRVDFRRLVRDLAKTFRTRIELRQIGVRDEAKMLGGLGSCGRPLCCRTWLRNFTPVGIKIAKDQGLSLNPTKISGVCDRLMCCLHYEHGLYRDMRRELPYEGEPVTIGENNGRVVEVRVLAQEVVVQLEDATRVVVAASDLKPPPQPPPQPRARRRRKKRQA